MNNQFTYPKEKIRFAILTFFFAQGLCMASSGKPYPGFQRCICCQLCILLGSDFIYDTSRQVCSNSFGGLSCI